MIFARKRWTGGKQMASKLFGKNIEPACAYCTHGFWDSRHEMILCAKKGVVAPYYQCRKFTYAPLKRVPQKTPRLPEYDKSEFQL